MVDWLATRSAATPDRTGMVEARGASYTYDELNRRVHALAGRLSTFGVDPGDHLGIVLETRPVAVELVHACLRLGAVLVPLNTRLTAQESRDRIDRADVDSVVCEAETEQTAHEATGDVAVASVDGPLRDNTTALCRIRPAEFEPAPWDWDSTEVIMFTSGTTGPAKAVELTTGNLFASAAASAFRLGVRAEDRWHCCLPIYHMGGLAPIFRSTLYGTAVIVQEGFEAETTLATMDTHGATGVSLVPTMLRRLLDVGDVTASLRFVLLGGAPAPRELIERCESENVLVHPTYGTTETASQIATARPVEAFADPGTVGRPLVGTTVTVVDESGSPQPPGEPGEVVVDGPTVMAGYYDDPDGTTDVLREHGFHTGDIGYLDDAGRLFVVNRLDDRIITGGETVDPGEVADVLREHPHVREAAVVGLPDEEWGQRVAAVVVPRGDLTASTLENHCRAHLAGFKCPRTIAHAGELPRTASGTVDRAALREYIRGENTSV